MSNNSGTGFWVIVGLMLVLVPVALVEAVIGLISRVAFGRTARPHAR